MRDLSDTVVILLAAEGTNIAGENTEPHDPSMVAALAEPQPQTCETIWSVIIRRDPLISTDAGIDNCTDVHNEDASPRRRPDEERVVQHIPLEVADLAQRQQTRQRRLLRLFKKFANLARFSMRWQRRSRRVIQSFWIYHSQVNPKLFGALN